MDENKKSWHIYVLKLEGEKYYVGVTSKTPEMRFNEHQSKRRGAGWTRLHKPIKIIDTKDLGVITYEKAEEFEKLVVREYIDKFGIDNVRGGDVFVTEPMIARFNRYFTSDNWEVLSGIVLLMIFILILAVMLYIKK
jgi:predicted GIY-YIG superfamily endonuclease